MSQGKRTCRWAAAAALALPALAAAQDAPRTGWFNTAELTAVWTGGNSPASTFGLKNALSRVWRSATFKFEAGGLRTESTRRTRAAQGTIDDHVVEETTATSLTAENYFVRGRWDRTLVARAFLFVGAGWSRNTFAGIDNRYSLVTGAGKAWVDREGRRFKTDLGATWTIQDDVVDDPGKRDSFVGVRLTAEALRALTTSATWSSTAVVDENLQDTQDLRADWTNSLRVAINSNLALQTSLQILYDRLPALVQVPLSGPGVPAGTKVLAPLDEVDTVFTVALVIGF